MEPCVFVGWSLFALWASAIVAYVALAEVTVFRASRRRRVLWLTESETVFVMAPPEPGLEPVEWAFDVRLSANAGWRVSPLRPAHLVSEEAWAAVYEITDARDELRDGSC